MLDRETLQGAVEAMREGQKVGDVARALGYENVSEFNADFAEVAGSSPFRYMQDHPKKNIVKRVRRTVSLDDFNDMPEEMSEGAQAQINVKPPRRAHRPNRRSRDMAAHRTRVAAQKPARKQQKSGAKTPTRRDAKRDLQGFEMGDVVYMRAKDLLLKPDADRQQIAASCGFQSWAHFDVAFQQKAGMRPGTFQVNAPRVYKAAALFETTDLSVEEVRKHVGYGSDEFFIRNFELIAGAKPGDFRAQKRGNKEAEMLQALKDVFKNTNKSTNQVAVEHGFGKRQNLLYFFRKHTGLTPSEYREQEATKQRLEL